MEWNNFLKQRKHLSPKQMAEILDLKPKTIYNWLYNGIIEGNRIGPSKFGRIRIPISELERVIANTTGREVRNANQEK